MGQLNRARIIGYLPNGMPVREIRGGSGPVFEPPAGGQPAGQTGGQQDPPADPDLLGGAPAPTGDAGGQQDPPPAGEQPPAWWAAASQQQTAAMNAEIDRRINQLNNPRRQQQATPPAGDPPANQQRPGIDQRDLRDARAEFRDVLRDSGLVLTAGEREFLNGVQAGIVSTELAKAGDPFEAGAAAARTAKASIEGLRKTHQAEIMSRLRAMGAIDESKLRPGATQQTTPRPGYLPGQQNVGDQFAGGVNRAAEAAARRGLVTPGAANPGQQ